MRHGTIISSSCGAKRPICSVLWDDSDELVQVQRRHLLREGTEEQSSSSAELPFENQPADGSGPCEEDQLEDTGPNIEALESSGDMPEPGPSAGPCDE